MNDTKEWSFIGIGLVAGAFITISYDLFQFWLTPHFPKAEAIPFIKAFSGICSIIIGLVVLIYFKYLKKKEN